MLNIFVISQPRLFIAMRIFLYIILAQLCGVGFISIAQSQQTMQAPVDVHAAQTISPAFVGTETPAKLIKFGYSLFGLTEESLKSLSAGGLLFPSSYRLGPGDRLGIYLLGKFQQSFEVIVNVEGKIYIPTVGVLFVADMSIEQVSQLLEKQLSKYYDNFTLNVMLIEPKRIPVLVAGDVNRPGKYYLSSLNTVLDAILAAGGPTPHGSLRNIKVYRQDQLIATVDFYEFLLTGELRNEVFLQQYDRIVVPLVESMVSIFGEVKRQAQFELKSGANERLSDLIYLAGGFTDLAFLDKIEISRLLPNGERTVLYVNYRDVLENDSCASNVILKNEDQIRVYSIQDQTYPKYVYIHGEVKRPGQYPYEENLHLLDLVLKAGNLTRSAYILECEVAKIDPKMPTRFKQIPLQRLMTDPNCEDNVLLEEDDRVFIRRIPEWEVGPTVEVRGEVNFPGIYAITKDSTRLSEIIDKAGGFTEKALIRDASLIRPSVKTMPDKELERLMSLTPDQMSKNEYQYLVMKQNAQDISEVVVDFYKVCVLKNKAEDPILEDGDIINVPRAPRVVYVTGRVAKPGGVLYKPNKRIKYYLQQAGGLAWDAKRSGTKVIKVTGAILEDEKVKDLEPGDIIWVPRKTDRNWWGLFNQTIAIMAQLATIYLIIDNALKR